MRKCYLNSYTINESLDWPAEELIKIKTTTHVKTEVVSSPQPTAFFCLFNCKVLCN